MSGRFYNVVKLKDHESTAIARPMSRMVARRAWLHRIIRDFTDPLLIIGVLIAVVRVRWMFIKLVKAGVIAMPSDPIAEYEDAKRRAAAATRPFVAPFNGAPPADAPATVEAAAGAAAPAAEPSNVTVLYPPPVREHVPHVDGELADVMAQIQTAW